MIIDLFPIKVYKKNIKEFIDDKLTNDMKLLLDEKLNEMKSNNQIWAESPTLETTRLMGEPYNKKLFSNKTFDKLKKVLIDNCKSYVENAFNYEDEEFLYKLNMWSNKYGDSATLQLHNHHSFHKKISGCYYMIKEEESPDIIFSNPIKNVWRYGVDREIN